MMSKGRNNVSNLSARSGPAGVSLRERWGDVHARTELDVLAERVVAGSTDPYAAADELLDSYTDQGPT